MPAIRRQINIAAPQRAVWRMLTTAEGWTAWYADEARIDADTGGRVVLQTEDDEGNAVEEVGTVLTYRPTRKLEIRWERGTTAGTVDTVLSFGLARDGDETRLSLVHRGAGPLEDEEARAQLDKTWRQSLKALRDCLED